MTWDLANELFGKFIYMAGFAVTTFAGYAAVMKFCSCVWTLWRHRDRPR